jgi:hypothetical protein
MPVWLFIFGTELRSLLCWLYWLAPYPALVAGPVSLRRSFVAPRAGPRRVLGSPAKV